MLSTYLLQTTQLLQNPPSQANTLYQTSDLTDYINTARGQLAGETECIRRKGTLALTLGNGVYSFTAIVFADTSVSAAFAVRGITFSIGTGQRWMRPRPFPYFQLYHLNNPVPEPGAPTTYSQYGQGSTGSIYVDPVPDQNYTLNLDCICAPTPLLDDTTVEAIPYPYTDAVPFFAAYLALMSARRLTDADALWKQYQTFAARARGMSNGPVLPQQYPQSPSLVRAGQLGTQQSGGK